MRVEKDFLASSRLVKDTWVITEAMERSPKSSMYQARHDGNNGSKFPIVMLDRRCCNDVLVGFLLDIISCLSSKNCTNISLFIPIYFCHSSLYFEGKIPLLEPKERDTDWMRKNGKKITV
jgi:hypothetical protein